MHHCHTGLVEIKLLHPTMPIHHPSLEDNIHFKPINIYNIDLCDKCQSVGYCRLKDKLGLEVYKKFRNPVVPENIERLVPVKLNGSFRPAHLRAKFQQALDAFYQQDYVTAISITIELKDHKIEITRLMKGLAYYKQGNYKLAFAELEFYGSNADLREGYQLHLLELLDTCKAMLELEQSLNESMSENVCYGDRFKSLDTII